MLEKLLESPDHKPQETRGQARRPEITYTVLLGVTTRGPHRLQVQPRKSLNSSESLLWKIPSCQAHPQFSHPTHRRVIRKVCTSKETTELVNCLFPSLEPSQPNPTAQSCSPRVLPAWKLMKQQTEQRADDTAIKLASLETPGKQQEWPNPVFYSISSYFGITVLTAMNRLMEGAGRALPSHPPHSTGGTSQDLCTQFSCFPSFLTSSTPELQSWPAQHYQYSLLVYTGAQLPFSFWEPHGTIFHALLNMCQRLTGSDSLIHSFQGQNWA